MKVSQLEAYQSEFLRAADLPRAVQVTVSNVALEDFYAGGKRERLLVLAFAGKQKRLVLNKTRAAQMVAAGGDDTDGWRGLVINLKPTTQRGKATIHIEQVTQ